MTTMKSTRPLCLSTCCLFILSLALELNMATSAEPSHPNRIGANEGDANEGEWIPLFNGKDLDGWYTWLPSTGKNIDPKGVFKVEHGVLHILDIPVTNEQQEFGYVATDKEYSNYRLRFQYRWGSKRFAPRANQPRDSGLLYHFVGPDGIWPRSVECQVQEGDTGDFYLLGGTVLITTVESLNPGPRKYKEDGVTYETQPEFDQIIRSGTYDSVTDWNTVEVIVSGDTAVHVVNGSVNNRGTRMRQGDPSDPTNFMPLTKGRILFQAEGAEVFYRNIEWKPLPSNDDSSHKVLVFSKTAGFRHDSIPEGVAAIGRLGEQHNFRVDATEDAAVFNDISLSEYRAVVFLSTTGDVLDGSQQAAFEHYIRAGNGYVGVHSATDTEYGWPWYGALVGSYFNSHPVVQTAADSTRGPLAPFVGVTARSLGADR